MNRFYEPWVAAGRHFVLATPIAEIKERVKARYPGAVVGTIGNEAHLTATAPEDHTPYSITPWPVPLPKDTVTAIDIANMPTLPEFVLYIINSARNGSAPWVKYVNYGGHHWTHLDGFQTVHTSTDSPEHCHISIRTDWCEKSIGNFYLWQYQTVVPLTRDLVLGDEDDHEHGPDVSHVQTLLNRWGAELVIDGVYGPKTFAAVKHFQTVHKYNGVPLKIDGVVGSKTYAALNA